MATFEEGRQAQFAEMMKRLEEISAKYGGVRGELLAKVKDELQKLEPSASPAAPVAVPAPVAMKPPTQMKVVTSTMLPSCRACGRTMKETGDGSLVCQNGHVRLLAS
jgi:hypothetical protein